MTANASYLDLIKSLPPDHFADDVRAGLSAADKYLQAKYLYDQAGSHLFEQITHSEHYYLTRAEESILRTYAAEILHELPSDAALVEMGSGSAAKTRFLLEALLQQQANPLFVPIDISRDFLFANVKQLSQDYPALRVLGIAADYHAGLEVLAHQVPQARLIVWLGSDVGHTDYASAAALLKQDLVPLLNAKDGVLLGIDLKKEADIFAAAYSCGKPTDSPEQAFTLNLLRRINRELDADFVLSHFQMQCFYDTTAGCMKIYLAALQAHQVTIKAIDLEVKFAEGERIHLHTSYKYDNADIQRLAAAAGLCLKRQWFDANHWFSLNLLTPLSTRP